MNEKRWQIWKGEKYNWKNEIMKTLKIVSGSFWRGHARALPVSFLVGINHDFLNI